MIPSGRRASRVRRVTASQSPLAIAGVGAELAELAADLARTGNRNLAGDAIAGALLAEAAAQAAARLVAINLTEGSRLSARRPSSRAVRTRPGTPR